MGADKIDHGGAFARAVRLLGGGARRRGKETQRKQKRLHGARSALI